MCYSMNHTNKKSMNQLINDPLKLEHFLKKKKNK